MCIENPVMATNVEMIRVGCDGFFLLNLLLSDFDPLMYRRFEVNFFVNSVILEIKK